MRRKPIRWTQGKKRIPINTTFPAISIPCSPRNAAALRPPRTSLLGDGSSRFLEPAAGYISFAKVRGSHAACDEWARVAKASGQVYHLSKPRRQLSRLPPVLHYRLFFVRPFSCSSRHGLSGLFRSFLRQPPLTLLHLLRSLLRLSLRWPRHLSPLLAPLSAKAIPRTRCLPPLARLPTRPTRTPARLDSRWPGPPLFRSFLLLTRPRPLLAQPWPGPRRGPG